MTAAAAVRGGVLALALLSAAACSSSKTRVDDPVISPPSSTSPAPVTSVAAPTSPLATSAPPSTTTASTPSTVSTSSAPPSTSKAATPAPPAPRSTCTKLTIRVIPGGASVGQEFAAIDFINDATTSCQLVGYPSVVLLRGGKILGRPSQPATTATSARTLAPGDTAESVLHDYVTNCQAALSDTLRVTAPGSSQAYSRPMQMRGCVLRVQALAAPD